MRLFSCNDGDGGGDALVGFRICVFPVTRNMTSILSA